MAGKGEGPAIGIDLGTSYSCVGVWQHNRVEIIANDHGNRTTPSYVAFTDTQGLIGDAAKNQVAINAVNTVFGEYLDGCFPWLGSLYSPKCRLKLPYPQIELMVSSLARCMMFYRLTFSPAVSHDFSFIRLI